MLKAKRLRLNTNHQGMGQLSASLNYSQHPLLHTIGILFLETAQRYISQGNPGFHAANYQI